ncbi:Phage holin T7 family, holin superfamily II [Azotobacter beijerinckii]|uniref:Phage holin T7 family, holin superfamily II n=1 Tax=Azotobacter beijerinckii TaxID=170623 RepID=A0A1H9MQ49_9GAMM|nr:hypothetical protein [Azotobacter beijerinckii]SER25816.1 Phage holin T7 family, holin superfamily II [Azotobacter beijerinckii]
MADQNLFQAAAIEAAKSAPPVAVTSAVIAGMSISDWVAILTGIYVLLQIVVLVRKLLRERKAERAGVERQ